MTSRPAVVAFDIIGTVFSLEPLRGPLAGLGLPPGALELWFAEGLRDAFALAATGSFQPFRSVLDAALEQVLAEHGRSATAAQRSDVLDGMKRLSPHADAGEAFRTLGDAGIRIVALSNGAAASTRSLLEAAGLIRHVELVLSVEDVGLSKPRREVYEHAARQAGVEPGALALIACHPWDIHGARTAGLSAGYVARGRPFPAVMQAPDVSGESLSEVARAFAAM
ncbi:haloacid dehalogenase type II (plasmid) [Skermanella rosea]|uniref:haloacid dehalogenase type II n=1 Tax=Skermanella rosea TaxID=1817965 RepID=UPI001932F98D|nr:haloacid dehalogenase type II [Skermanella rosea]UEM06917.1 haloacid dehalogenase type II [Skermanella rosea]